MNNVEKEKRKQSSYTQGNTPNAALVRKELKVTLRSRE